MFALPPSLRPEAGFQVSGVACPDCGGVLQVQMHLHKGHVDFLCRIGHGYALPDLLLSKEQVIEDRLWSALVAVEELVALLRDLRDEGRVMLVSTHNLGSVPQFCDHVVLINRTILAHGPTDEVFTRENIERAFGGVLRHFTLGGADLHDDADTRQLTVISDDERPFVVYGDAPEDEARDRKSVRG